MNFVIILTLVSLAVAAPPSADKQLVVTDKFFPEKLVIYTADHDIVDIVVPLNHYYSTLYNNNNKTVLVIHKRMNESELTKFFVEADVKNNGEKDYKGLYVYKNGVAKKVLDNGQCSTYTKNGIIYFGASDGIYKYNEKDQTATKYGTVTDNIISIATDVQNVKLYYLTSDYVLYKFDEDEKVATRVEAVKDARDIVCDLEGNLFYYDGGNQFYTYNGEKVLKIEGLPAGPSKVEFMRSVESYAVIDGYLYNLIFDGTSEKLPIKFQAKPTAFAPDATWYQYYAYKKKLYMYDWTTVLSERTIEELSEFFGYKEDPVNAFNTMKMSVKL